MRASALTAPIWGGQWALSGIDAYAGLSIVGQYSISDGTA